MPEFGEKMDFLFIKAHDNRDKVKEDIKFNRGVYFWFADNETTQKLLPQTNLDFYQINNNNATYNLMYIGIGPRNGYSQNQFIKQRILNCHLGKRISNSTFRQTLSSLLEMQGQIKQVGQSEKIFITDESENEVTRLINDGFLLGVMKNGKPWDLEEPLIRRYRPPLNLQHNQAGPFYEHVKCARACQRKKARL